MKKKILQKSLIQKKKFIYPGKENLYEVLLKLVCNDGVFIVFILGGTIEDTSVKMIFNKNKKLSRYY